MLITCLVSSIIVLLVSIFKILIFFIIKICWWAFIIIFIIFFTILEDMILYFLQLFCFNWSFFIDPFQLFSWDIGIGVKELLVSVAVIVTYPRKHIFKSLFVYNLARRSSFLSELRGGTCSGMFFVLPIQIIPLCSLSRRSRGAETFANRFLIVKLFGCLTASLISRSLIKLNKINLKIDFVYGDLLNHLNFDRNIDYEEYQNKYYWIHMLKCFIM